MISLDRRSITGPVSHTTPLCVLREIAQCHSIDYPSHLESRPNFSYKLLSNIDSVPVPSISTNSEEWTTKDLTKIAKYINPDTTVTWTKKNLILAYEWLKRFTGDYELPTKITLGQQRPDSIESVNCCILYRMLNHKQIEVKYHTTLEQMYQIYLDMKLPEIYLKRSAQLAINSLSSSELLTLMIKHNIDYRPPHVDKLDFSSLPPKITLEQAQKSASAAIAYAARSGLNLTRAKYPTVEIHGIVNNNYIPQNDDCIELMKVDPFSFQLVYNFEPLIPLKYYTINILSQCLRANGIVLNTTDSEEMYRSLTRNLSLPTFHHGKHQTIVNTETITGETVSELNHSDVVCYGVKSRQLTAMTYDELLASFQAAGMPVNPVTRTPTPLNTSEFSRLIQLATIHKKIPLQTYLENYSKTDVLDQMIARIAALRRSQHQNKIDTVLKEIVNMAMFARGWDGKGDYPIKTNGPHTHLAETNTMNCMLNVYSLDAELAKETRLNILEFPLLKFNHDRYVKITSQEKGRTLGERMLIMKYSNVVVPIQGYEIYCNNVNGCIRMSSNYILASLYYIGLHTGFKPGYEIIDLQWLS